MITMTIIMSDMTQENLRYWKVVSSSNGKDKERLVHTCIVSYKIN